MDNHWDNLPEHLQDHIKTYIPMTFMSSELQTDIKAQSALFKINRLDNLIADKNNIELRDQYLFCYLDSDDIIRNLMDCGCCVRHSGFKRTKNLGSRFINKVSLLCFETDCKCACRHWIRTFFSPSYRAKFK